MFTRLIPLLVRNLRQFSSTVLVCVVIPYSVYASETSTLDQSPLLDLSVEEAISVALANNIQLTNSRLRRSIDRFALQLAESEFHPRVVAQAYAEQEGVESVTEGTGLSSAIRLRVQTGGEFTLGTRIDRDEVAGNETDSHDGVMEFSFRQPLLRGGGFQIGRATIQTARLDEEISVLAFKAAVINLTTNVIRAYRAHIQARRQIGIAERSLERARNLLEINQLLVQTGRMAEQDVVQAEADLARRELSLVIAQGFLDSTRLSLIDVLDLNTETQFGELDTLDPSQIEQPILDHDVGMETALRYRPDFLSAQLGIQTAEIRSKVAKNDRLWDLSLNLGWTFRGSENELSLVFDELERTGERVSLDLEIPIGRAAAGPRELAFRRAEANLQIAYNSIKDLNQQITIDVTNAIRDTELAQNRMALAIRARELAEQKARIEREKLSLGVSTNFQLVAFENDLVVAETSELNALVDYLNAISGLDKALGTTLARWDIDIEQIDALPQSSPDNPSESLVQ